MKKQDASTAKASKSNSKSNSKSKGQSQPKTLPKLKEPENICLPKGWQCPCCNTVHAPEVKACWCRNEAKAKVEHMKEIAEAMKKWKDEARVHRPPIQPMEWPSRPTYVHPIYILPHPMYHPPGAFICESPSTLLR